MECCDFFVFLGRLARFKDERPKIVSCLRLLWKSTKEVEFFQVGSRVLKQLGYNILPCQPEMIVQVIWIPRIHDGKH